MMPSDAAKLPMMNDDGAPIPQLREYDKEFATFDDEKREFQQATQKASAPDIERLPELPDREPFILQPEDKEKQEKRFDDRIEQRIPDMQPEESLLKSLKESGVEKDSFQMPDKQRKDIRQQFQKDKEDRGIEDPSQPDTQPADLPGLSQGEENISFSQMESQEGQPFSAPETEGLDFQSQPIPSLQDYTSPSSLDSLMPGAGDDQLGQLTRSIDSLVASLGNQQQDNGDYPQAPYSQAFHRPHQHTDFMMGGN